jgi:hypothetical protein
VGKLEGKVAVITGATSGMALAAAKLFVEEGGSSAQACAQNPLGGAPSISVLGITQAPGAGVQRRGFALPDHEARVIRDRVNEARIDVLRDDAVTPATRVNFESSKREHDALLAGSPSQMTSALAASFLAGDDARWIPGQVIVAAGGKRM